MQKTSKQLFEQAQQFIPGGVNSPARAFKSVGGNPIFFESANGSILKDIEGNEYIDYIGSWGPMILGHKFPKVVEAVHKMIDKSTSFGAPTEIEIEIAELICKNVPNVDKIRMVNSGTEATMSAIRLARGFTKRDKFIKFDGNYHGHCDSFLIKAGSGAITLGSPNSPGVTKGTAQDTILANYNDLQSVEKAFENNKNQIAAIIVEPVAGNMGCVPPNEGFLEGLRDLCDKNSALLIFDEVMTGFRLAFGGAQELFEINADIVCYGKVIGGGMPVGAYGARNEIMDYISPVGAVYQAGTLSGNPVAMASGYALLTELLENKDHIYKELDEKTLRLENGLGKILLDNNITGTINRVGSMITLFFADGIVSDMNSASKGDNDRFKKFFHGMLSEGIYLPPSSYEAWFVSNSHSMELIDKTLEAAIKVIRNL